MLPILVVDDQAKVREALQLLLEMHDLPSVAAASPAEALAIARRERLGAVIQDMNFERGRTTGEEGVSLFRDLRKLDPELPVLLITAWTALETAVQLVKEGADDYLAKPWDDQSLIAAVSELRQARMRSDPEQSSDRAGLVFASESMARVVDLARRVAASEVPVLITGANGSGKERIADLIHRHGGDENRPYLKVNTGALPEELMEAELFGAEVGAFTGSRSLRVGRFEAADGGTLFLDEVDALSLAGQVKLLRVLETGEFQRLGSSRLRTTRVRVLSATNSDLERAVEQGGFRQDLYFRLNVVEIKIPALQERPEDILALARHFIAELGSRKHSLSEGAERELLAHSWPGNVRELRNRVQRALLMSSSSTLTAADFDFGGQRFSEQPLLDAEAQLDRKRIERALLEAGGVIARAAEILGMSRQALYRRMARLDIVLERKPRAP